MCRLHCRSTDKRQTTYASLQSATSSPQDSSRRGANPSMEPSSHTAVWAGREPSAQGPAAEDAERVAEYSQVSHPAGSALRCSMGLHCRQHRLQIELTLQKLAVLLFDRAARLRQLQLSWNASAC